MIIHHIIFDIRNTVKKNAKITGSVSYWTGIAALSSTIVKSQRKHNK